MPWLLGTVSALFGLLWFVLLTLLPGVWSCISYGLAITFSIAISLLLDAAPTESLARFQDAVSPSFDPVDILCYAAFGRH